jgi:serine/threonine-protein kinase RsbW
MNSPAAGKTVQIVIGNSFAEMEKVVDLVERFGADHAIPQRVVINLNICLDELINNAISYGHADRQAHEIMVKLSYIDDAVTAEIRDDGAPFDPRTASSGPAEGRIGGLGLHFVRSLMDEFGYRREGSHNVVTISKRI